MDAVDNATFGVSPLQMSSAAGSFASCAPFVTGRVGSTGLSRQQAGDKYQNFITFLFSFINRKI